MLKGLLLNEYLNLECIIESIFDLNFKVKKHGRGSFNRTRVTRTLFCFALCSITVLEVEARGAPVIPWRPLHLHSLRKSMVQSSDLQQEGRIHAQGILLWDPEAQEQRPPDGCFSQQRKWRAVFNPCICRPFHCMGTMNVSDACWVVTYCMVILCYSWWNEKELIGKKWKEYFMLFSKFWSKLSVF